MSSLSSNLFSQNTNLRMIDLSDNKFSSLPSGLFDGLNKLAEVHLYKITWSCSCNNNWFVPYARNKNITLFGELRCFSG